MAGSGQKRQVVVLCPACGEIIITDDPNDARTFVRVLAALAIGLAMLGHVDRCRAGGRVEDFQRRELQPGAEA